MQSNSTSGAPKKSTRPQKTSMAPAMRHALVVDDEQDAAQMLATLIASENFTVATAYSLLEARRQIVLQQPDIILLDLHLPDGSGMELLDDKALVEQAEIVLITGQASLETSIQALRLGAADYIVKPVSMKQLQGVLSRVMRPSVLQEEVSTLTQEWEETGRFGHLWGRAAAMQSIYQQISRVAVTGVTVFVSGESGSGKEVVARTLHDLSRRRNNPFLAVNCGAISPTLIESEIFGHEKGSFTGADKQHQGFFERAHGGTLFLDEVTEMPLELQVKLLRVLETGMFMRVGSTEAMEADVRIISATNRLAEDAVASGRLREDLFYRLNVFPINLPPLRDRLDDVSLLARHFLQIVCEREGQAKEFSEGALARLTQYRWPGNIRELRNVVQRAYVMTAENTITEEWLPKESVMASPSSTLPLPLPTPTPNQTTIPSALTLAPSSISSQNTIDSATPVSFPASQPTKSNANLSGDGSSISIRLGTSMADVEYQLIVATLKHFNNHKERTAAVLGVSLKTLYNRLKEYEEKSIASTTGE